MPIAVPQDILDALTDVKMPRISREAPESTETITVGGWELPLWQVDTLVVGSGSAGLRAAVEYKRLGGEPVVISSSLFGGTSACSGSINRRCTPPEPVITVIISIPWPMT